MKLKFFLGFLVLAVSVSGCVATQSDVSTLQERVVTTETKLGSLEKSNQEAMGSFEGDWNRKLAGLSEDILGLRERISSVEGSMGTLGEQISQETDKAEKFRSGASRDLADFQKGVAGQLDQLRGEVALVKKAQADNAAALDALKKRADELKAGYGVLTDRVNQFDTGLAVSRDETTRKLAVVVDEVSRENQSLRDRIAELEKKLSAGEPTPAKKPAAKKPVKGGGKTGSKVVKKKAASKTTGKK